MPTHEPGGRPNPAQQRVVLRGATLISAPFTLIGIIAASLAIFGLLWTVDRGGDSGSGWLFFAITAAVAVLAFTAARGCKVVVRDAKVHDVVAWRKVRVTPTASIEAIRVRRGVWRTFEIETNDSRRTVVLGAGPVQFPSNLMPGARERDLAAIDAMGGELRS
ncbi:MAG: hypothetical protein ACR2OH_11095 [Microthrixaceae bacterium]